MSIGKRVTIGFASLFVLQLALAIVTIYNSVALTKSQRLVNHSLQVMDSTEEFKSALTRMESSERGYLITAEEDYFDRYSNAANLAPALYHRLYDLVADNREQRVRMDRIEKEMSAKLAFAQHAIHLHDEKGSQSALAQISKDVRKVRLLNAFTDLNRIQDDEQVILNERNQDAAYRGEMTILVVVIGSMLAILMVLWESRNLTQFLVRPINGLVEAVKKIKNGDWEQVKLSEPSVHSDDELQQLRNAFYEMARQRRHAEEELRSTSALLQGLFHACPLAVSGVDRNFRVSFWNPAAERLFGWKESEVIGRPIPNISPERRKESEAVGDSLRKGHAVVGFETVRQKRDGGHVPVSISSAPIIADNEFLGAVALIEDISERKRQDNQKAYLIESQRALNQMFEATAYASVIISDQAIWHHHDFNFVLKTIVEQAQLITRADYAAIGVGTDPDKPFNPWISTGEGLAHLEAPRARGVLGWVARHGQSVRLLDVKTSPAFQGMPIGDTDMEAFLGVPIRYEGRSVGNLYLAKKAGQTPFSQEDQRAIELLSAHCGIVIQNSRLYETISRERKRLKLLSECTSAMVNSLEANDILERTCNKLTESFAAACAFDVFEKDQIRRVCTSLAHPSEFSFEFGNMFKLRNGHPLSRAVRRQETVIFPLNRETLQQWFFCAKLNEEEIGAYATGMIVPVILQNRLIGLMTLAFGSSTDVPEDQRLAEEIASRVALSLENARLYQESRRALQAREDTVAIVSHDLKNPLSAIGIAAELLHRATAKVDATDPGELHAVLEKRIKNPIKSIQRAVAQGQRLIHDLLDLAKIESGSLGLSVESVSVNTLVREVVDLLTPIAKERQIALNLLNHTQSLRVDCDAVRIQQVLSNLVGNAIKFSYAGGEVRLDVSDKDHEFVFAVRDNGRGIPEDKLAVIFERYYQGKEGQRQGSGLGLFIAKGIVEAHNGRIWVESKPGGGTTVYFTLPREAQHYRMPDRGSNHDRVARI